jgi:hypothetical protein
MAELGIRRLADADVERWDEFVGASLNGTLFQRRRFLAYHPQDRFEDHSLLFCEGARLVGVLPAAVIERKGRRILKSHPGASYGGIVVAHPPGLKRASRMTELLVEWAAELGLDAVEMRLAPRIYCASPCDELEFALRLQRFRELEVELSTCYDVAALGAGDVPAERILDTFQPACARATRKALAGALEARLCEERTHFDAYWEMLAANLEKHDARPTHSASELYALKQRFPADVQLLGVFLRGEIVGGVVAFVCNRRAAHVFYFASRPEQQRERPLNLAVLELIRFAARRELRYVNFGISTEAGGTAVNWGLFRFKESFGAGGTLRSYWAREL